MGAVALIDGTGVVVIDLPLVRYTIHPYGQEVDAWPPALNFALWTERTIIAWEVWCESLDMRRSG